MLFCVCVALLQKERTRKGEGRVRVEYSCRLGRALSTGSLYSGNLLARRKNKGMREAVAAAAAKRLRCDFSH